MSCADCTSLYFAFASLSPGLRSGWYFFDSLRYALLISSAVADFETPRTSYGSRGMVVFIVVVVGRTGSYCSGAHGRLREARTDSHGLPCEGTVGAARGPNWA